MIIVITIIVAAAYLEFLYNVYKCKNEVKRKKIYFEKHGKKLK
jgi:hypothetical protein